MQRHLTAVYVSAVAVTYGSPDHLSQAVNLTIAGGLHVALCVARFCRRIVL